MPWPQPSRLVPPESAEGDPTATPAPASIGCVDDSDLVARARQGDGSAFGELVDRHRHAVFRAALAVLRSREDADDVAQEAFVAAFEKLAGFRQEASFKTWVLKIAWRQALDRRRGLTRRLKHFVGVEHDEWPDPLSTTSNHEARVLDSELVSHVARLVGRLPPALRETLLLASSGDVSYAEIAEILEISKGTVKWRVSEARSQLKEGLRKLGYDHG